MAIRSSRVGDQILKEVSGMLVRGEIRDPRVSAVSVTEVRMTDLGMAEIYFTLPGGEAGKDEALSGLESAKGFIRGRLASRLRMRKVPDIKFVFDTTLEKGYRIDEILREISGE